MFSKDKRMSSDEIKGFIPRFFVNSTFFSIKVSNNQVNKSRFAVIVPKKTNELSVSRHEIKRRVSHLLVKLDNELSLKKQDYLIYVNKKANNENADKLKQDFLETINNNKLLFLEKI